MSNSNPKRGRPPREVSQQRDLHESFARVLAVYIDCKLQPLAGAVNYDGRAKRTLRIGGLSQLFAIDVEISNRRALPTPELKAEFLRLAEEAYRLTCTRSESADTKPAPRTAEQRKLTDTVIRLAAREYKRRNLDKIGDYFRLARTGGRVDA